MWMWTYHSILAILLLLVIALFVTKRSVTDSVVVILSAIIILLSIKQGSESPRREAFSGGGGGTGLDRVLNSISTSSPDDLGRFGTGLTLYYSAFSQKSYPMNSRKWYNISPYFVSNEKPTQQTCANIYPETHLYFSEIPSFSKTSGFLLGKNKAIGPRSHELGITANDSFTVGLMLQFDAFTVVTQEGDAPRSVELLKLFANTQRNNGLDFGYTSAQAAVGGQNMFNVVFYVYYGETHFQSTPITINTSFVYMVTIVKTMGTIAVNLFPNVGDIASTPQLFNTILTLSIGDMDDDADVLLSNKEMQLNGTRNAQAHLYALAIWNKLLPDFVVADFYSALQAELQKNNETLRNLASQITTLQQKLTAGKQCPFDESTCSACSGVKDWTSATDLMQNGGEACLRSINGYCTANPSLVPNICSCWNPANVLSKTPYCKSYRSIFTGTHTVSAADIDTDTLEQIKTQFNLCACTTSSVDTCQATEDAPKLVPKVRWPEKSDLDYYNELPGIQPTVQPSSWWSWFF